MRESRKTRILYWSWNLLALLCVAVVVFANMPKLATKLTDQKAFYGDIFKLSQVDTFKVSLPLDGTQSRTSLAGAQVITIGDSFFNTNIGSPFFANMLEAKSGLPTFNVTQDAGYYGQPAQFFATKKPAQAKTLVWEQVERNIAFQYLTTQPSATRDIESLIPGRIRATGVYKDYVAVRDAVFNPDPVLFFATHSAVTRSLFETLATIRFYLTGDISPRAPEYSLDPLMGFYDGELTYARVPLSDGDVAIIADRIATQIHQVEKDSGVQVIYVPLPSKYTVYRYLLNNQTYNNLLPRLVTDLRQRGVRVVDMLPLYQQHVQNGGGWLYYPNDTHWTKKAKKMAVKEVANLLPRGKATIQ